MKNNIIGLSALMFLLIYIFNIVKLEDVVASDFCIHSFDTFAFQGPRQSDEDLFFPPSSWESTDLVSIIDETGFTLHRVEAFREYENRYEIWFAGQLDGELVWLIYNLATTSAQFISNEYILDSQVYYIGDLYVGNNGQIWGFVQAQDYSINGLPDTTTRPILMFYDEISQRFQVKEGTLNLSKQIFPQVILDEQDVFWIVVKNQGVYKFETFSGQTTKVIDMLDLRQPIAITLFEDNKIIFQVESPDLILEFNLTDTLYELHTDTGELTLIDTPLEDWPLSKGILIDQLGRLWLGANGFRDLDGNWNLIHSNLDGYWKEPISHMRSTPQILIETSDGRLWFTNWWDGGIWYHGTAWYDPNTQSGCMFTNLPASFIEDNNQTLWMVAGGNLYKYPLND